MKTRTYAELTPYLPDDTFQRPDGQFCGGRNVAEAIAEILAGLGYQVSEPVDAGDHGWDLDVKTGGKRIWIEVQTRDILMTEALLSLSARLFGSDLSYYAEFLTKLSEGLGQDPRFGPTRWYRLVNHSPFGEPSEDPLSAM